MRVEDVSTLLVEYTESKEFKGISLQRLEGEFESPEEFEKAYEHHAELLKVVSDQIKKMSVDSSKTKTDYKIFNFIPMSIDSATKLRDILNELIEASRARACVGEELKTC